MKIRDAQKFSNKVVDALKKERQAQGISMYRIAKDCGISDSSLSMIENHKRNPTLYTLSIIASYLKVELSDIIKRVE